MAVFFVFLFTPSSLRTRCRRSRAPEETSACCTTSCCFGSREIRDRLFLLYGHKAAAFFRKSIHPRYLLEVIFSAKSLDQTDKPHGRPSLALTYIMVCTAQRYNNKGYAVHDNHVLRLGGND